MTHATFPRRPCARIVPDRRSPDAAQASTPADLLESAIWPLLPLPAVRAISVALLLAVAAGGLAAFARDVHAQSTDILLSNAGPPAAPRLLLVNVTQRQVAQEFTTGPHPAGYDIYAAAIRTEKSSGKRDMGLQGMIRNRRWEPVGPWNMMLPHRQVGPTLTRSRPVADADWSWFMSSEPIHLEPNETYFFELDCRWGCFVMENGVGLGLTESNDEDESTLPGWSMADGFMTQNTRFNRWWGDMVVGTDGFFHPNPQGPVLRLAFRGEPTEMDGLPSDEAGAPELSAPDVQAREAPHARLTFRVTLSAASAEAVSVRYATADGTATAGTDYVATSGRLLFAPGQTQRTVDVPVLHDARSEAAETLTLRLSGATGARLADAVATGTIVNADSGAREWMARSGPITAWRVADAAGQRPEGGTARVTMGGMQPLPPGAEARREWQVADAAGRRHDCGATRVTMAGMQPLSPGAEARREWQVTDAAGRRPEGGTTRVTMAGMQPLSPGAEARREALGAQGSESGWVDSGRALVGTWSTRFGAMPVPRATPAAGSDSAPVPSEGAPRNVRHPPSIRPPDAAHIPSRIPRPGALLLSG